MTKDRSRGITRSKWFLPSFSLVLGLIMLAVSWLGGSPGQGVISLAVLAAFGLIILLAGRSETVRGLRGDGIVTPVVAGGGDVVCGAVAAGLLALPVSELSPLPAGEAGGDPRVSSTTARTTIVAATAPPTARIGVRRDRAGAGPGTESPGP
jgi:hypothetical protein